jgi:hypothetical protein
MKTNEKDETPKDASLFPPIAALFVLLIAAM